MGDFDNIFYYDKFIQDLIKVDFKYFGKGHSRKVYYRNNIVIKIPINISGIKDNISEATTYKKFKNKPTKKGAMFAPCRLLKNTCLMMVKVDPIKLDCPDDDSINEWSWLIEGQQLGVYKGKEVAYDYAEDFIFRIENL